MIRQVLAAAEDADALVHAVVGGGDIVVGDRPVVAQAVTALAPEVVGAEAERDPAPVIGAAAEHAGAPPVELGVGGAGVRLAVNVPAADAGVELAERPLLGGRAAP